MNKRAAARGSGIDKNIFNLNMSPTGSHNPNAYDARLTFEIRFVAYETKDVVDRLLNERYTDEIFGKQYSTQPFSPLITLLARQIRVVTEQPCIDVVDRFDLDPQSRPWIISADGGFGQGGDSAFSDEEYAGLVEDICGVPTDEMDHSDRGEFRPLLKKCRLHFLILGNTSNITNRVLYNYGNRHYE